MPLKVVCFPGLRFTYDDCLRKSKRSKKACLQKLTSQTRDFILGSPNKSEAPCFFSGRGHGRREVLALVLANAPSLSKGLVPEPSKSGPHGRLLESKGPDPKAQRAPTHLIARESYQKGVAQNSRAGDTQVLVFASIQDSQNIEVHSLFA